MKASAIVRGGLIGGILTAAALAYAGQVISVTLPPWDWRSMTPGNAGQMIQWTRTAAVLAPFCVALAIVGAFACGVVFEYVTHRAGCLVGAVVGVGFGVCVASVVALAPWAASWFSYSYMPSTPPLGVHDPSWSLAAVVAAGALAGAVAGWCYGMPRHASVARPAVRWREIAR